MPVGEKPKMSDLQKTFNVVSLINLLLLPTAKRLGGPFAGIFLVAGGFALHEYGKPKTSFFSSSAGKGKSFDNVCAGGAKVHDKLLELVEDLQNGPR